MCLSFHFLGLQRDSALLVPTGDPPSLRSGTLMSRRRTPSLCPVGKTLDPGSVRAGLVCDTGITNWRGRGAVAFSAFCWLRQACFVTLAPLRVPDVTTEGTIPPPRRKNTRPRFSKGRACARDTDITNLRGRGCRLSQSSAGSAGSTFVGRASYTLPPRRRREPALASLRAP